MKHKNKKIIIALSIVVLLIIFFSIYLSSLNFEVLNPKGIIALQERNLIYLALGLSLFVVIPVYTLLILFAYKYRASNKESDYKPNWDKNAVLETIWWVIPSVLIAVLGYFTWTSSHALDPFKKLSPQSSKNLRIEVVALDWRWLFIYPDQKIATMNYFKMPVNTNVTFYITSSAPMNSFWIPQLAGQIYAMPGMNTELNLSSYQTGIYRGLSANLSGIGFSNMTFNDDVVSTSDFLNWVNNVKASNNALSYQKFLELSKPKVDSSIINFSNVDTSIYVKLINSYMNPVEKYKTNQNLNNPMAM